MMKNLKNYVANAIVFRDEFKKRDTLQEKFAIFTYLFDDFKDKIVCKALFDMKFVDEPKIRKFIDNMINDLNKAMPQKITDVIDVYLQSSTWIVKEVEKEKKWWDDVATKQGLLRFSEFIKNGKSIIANGNENSNNPNIIFGNQINPDLENQKTVSKNSDEGKGVKTVTRVPKAELEKAMAEENARIQMQRQEALKRESEERARERNETERVRRNKVEEAKALQEMQNMLKKHTD